MDGEEINEERGLQFRIDVPTEEKGGAYANFLSVWHSPHEFTLDFAATQTPEVPDDPESPIVVPCHVVSRVKIPVSVIFDVLRALNENMTLYEAKLGDISRPASREEK